MDSLVQYQKAIGWLQKHTIPQQGICISSERKMPYPEVTGYYIPTLLEWGFRDLAKQYGRWLVEIQNRNGSWNAPDRNEAYVFDSAQVLKGLLALYKITGKYKEQIIKGTEWIISNMQEDGRLTTPSEEAWGDETWCSELVHIYCIQPLYECAEVFGRNDIRDAAKRIEKFYIGTYKEKILKFHLLSHFYAYIIEGLIDINRTDLARQAMENIRKRYGKDGCVPGTNKDSWICSTGLFQLAVVWYKLGEVDNGNQLFEIASGLQNASGGWFGSYPAMKWNSLFCRHNAPAYFPKEEISWGLKYYLDALYLKNILEFENMAHIFSDTISKEDGRYLLIFQEIKQLSNEESPLQILDIGCGKGRYLKNIFNDLPTEKYFAVDISSKVMENIDQRVIKKQGSLLEIPFSDYKFDIIYTIEALEHAVHTENALKELLRVLKASGKLIIIDKNKEKLGKLRLCSYEQWFLDKNMIEFADENKMNLKIVHNIPYEDKDGTDGMFTAWIFERKK